MRRLQSLIMTCGILSGFNLVLLGVLFVFCFLNPVSAQVQPDIEWSKIFEYTTAGYFKDPASSIQQTTDGGYIMIGHEEPPGRNNNDVWLSKTDARGNKEWEKTFDRGDVDYGVSVRQTSDGGYIIVGDTADIYATSNSFGRENKIYNHNIWLIKTDAQGNKEWEKVFDRGAVTTNSVIYPSDIIYLINNDGAVDVRQTSDGGYIILGGTAFSVSNTAGGGSPWEDVPPNLIPDKADGGGNIWLIKTDAQGSKEWDKVLDKNSDIGSSIEQTKDGGYIVACNTSTNLNGNFKYDLWLFKTDAHGNIQWEKTSGRQDWSWTANALQTFDGGYLVAGTIEEATSTPMDYRTDALLIKTDAQGNTEWERVFDKSDGDRATNVVLSSDGGYVIPVEIYGVYGDFWDTLLIKTDSNGNEEWAERVGENSSPFHIEQTSDGGYILLGDIYVNGSEFFELVKLGWAENQLVITDADINKNTYSLSDKVVITCNVSDARGVKIPDAAVTAEIEKPDGTKETVPLTFITDLYSSFRYYAGIFEPAPGEGTHIDALGTYNIVLHAERKNYIGDSAKLNFEVISSGIAGRVWYIGFSEGRITEILPVQGAKVVIKPSGSELTVATVNTNAQGGFEVKTIKPGIYDIEVDWHEEAGRRFLHYNKQIEVVANKILWVEFPVNIVEIMKQQYKAKALKDYAALKQEWISVARAWRGADLLVSTFMAPRGILRAIEESIPHLVLSIAELFPNVINPTDPGSITTALARLTIETIETNSLIEIENLLNIVYDPPDKNYTEIFKQGVLNPIALPADYNGILTEPIVELANALAKQSSLETALLTSFERYQGAIEDSKPEFMSMQLKAIIDYSNLFMDNEEKLGETVSSVRSEMESLKSRVEPILKPLQTRLLSEGFTSDEKTALKENGFSDSGIEMYKQFLLTFNFEELFKGLDALKSVSQSRSESAYGLLNNSQENLALIEPENRDSIPPVTQAEAIPQANGMGWNNSNVTVNLTSTDNQGGSGVKEIHYKLTGAETKETVILGDTAQISIVAEGVSALTYWAVDDLGNSEAVKSLEIKIDKTPPIITSAASPQANSYGWNNTDVTVSFTASDNLSGVASVSNAVTVAAEGANQNIGGEAVDFADNKASSSLTLNIDKTPPEVSLELKPINLSEKDEQEDEGNRYELIYSAKDNLSGLKDLQAGLVVISLAGFKQKLEADKELEIKIDEKKKELKIESPNPQSVLEGLKDSLFNLNNNQLLQLKVKQGERKWKIKEKHQGLEMQAPSCIFKAIASDIAGNQAAKELKFSKDRARQDDD